MGINNIVEIGTNLKDERKKRGLTQKDMAKLLELPRSTYANYENNTRIPTKEMLTKISNTLNIPPFKLIQHIWDEFDEKIDTEGLAKDAKIAEAIQTLLSYKNYNINSLSESDYEKLRDYILEQIDIAIKLIK